MENGTDFRIDSTRESSERAECRMDGLAWGGKSSPLSTAWTNWHLAVECSASRARHLDHAVHSCGPFHLGLRPCRIRNGMKIVAAYQSQLVKMEMEYAEMAPWANGRDTVGSCNSPAWDNLPCRCSIRPFLRNPFALGWSSTSVFSPRV